MLAPAVDTRSRLIGRRHELARVRAALEALRRGEPGRIAIAGEAGVGKTFLLDEIFGDEGPELVLRSRAAEIEQSVPFGLIADAVPDLLPRLALSPLASAADRFRAHYAIRSMLEERARRRPLVIALDDVQWADAPSVELLAHLLRRRLERPILLVLAYRAESAPALLLDTIGLATREDRLELLELAPLTYEEASGLLGPDVDSVRKRLLFRESGGNPFYLEQLARMPVDGAMRASLLVRESAAITTGAIPAAVHASLSPDLDRLSAPARTLLNAAAVAGEPFDPDVLAAIVDLNQQEALDALDELVASDLVRSTPTPRRFVFRHPIVNRAVYEATPPGWRLAAHERAVEVLRSRDEPSIALAHHVERSARAGDGEAIDVLTTAAEEAVARTPVVAARWLHAALRLAPSDRRQDTRRARMLVALAAALSRAGQLENARAAVSEALEDLPGSERAMAVTLLAHTEAFLGRHGEARTLLVDALQTMPAALVGERAALELELAAHALRGGDRSAAVEWSARALQAARDLDDRSRVLAATALAALVAQEAGAIAAARERTVEAAQLVERLPDHALADSLRALCQLAEAEAALGDPRGALAHAERGLAIARDTGQVTMLAPLARPAVLARLALGNLVDAANTVDSMLEAAEVLDLDVQLASAWSLAGAVAAQRGDVDAALRAADRAVQFAEATCERPLADLNALSVGEAWVAGREPARAHEHLMTLAGGADLPRVAPGWRGRWYELLIEADIALGRLEDAGDWLKRAESALVHVDLLERRSAVQRSRALLALAEGDPTSAAAAARAALEGFERSGARVAWGVTATLAARALLAIGDADAAIELLEGAERELDAAGAEGAHAQVADELRRLARHVPRRRETRSADARGLDALSERERAVAELVAEGRTNREIGAALYLSQRTVEKHLTQVFRTLGLSSRAEVAREVSRPTARPSTDGR